MASPEARWAMAATASGKTGAMHTTWTKRIATNAQTLLARESTARETRTSTPGARAPPAGRRGPRPRAAPPSCPAPCRGRQRAAPGPRPRASRRACTPSRGNTWGRIAVRKKTCVRQPSTRPHTVASSRSDAVPARACGAVRPRPAGTPQPTSAAQRPSIAEASRKDRAEAEARGGERARRGPQHLAERHPELDLRHLAPHVAPRPPRHDKGKRGHRAHRPEQEPGEEDLRQAPREGHQDEARALQALRPHERALGIAIARESSRDRRRDHGDERADPEDEARPAERRRLVERRHVLDVERQAHVDERPREAPEEHGERQGPAREEIAHARKLGETMPRKSSGRSPASRAPSAVKQPFAFALTRASIASGFAALRGAGALGLG